ncbi:MAG: dihydrofolate reductase [Candidatus Saccharimonadales bacterium]|nr:dihydrofolate reductase [Candidatus Saccharimonadales bacterium]
MLSIITAIGRNREMGQTGGLPWGNTMKNDRQWFRDHIDGHLIIAGRKTFEETAAHFPRLRAVVFSRQPATEQIKGIRYISNVSELADLHSSSEEVFVIGGAEINALLLSYCRRLYLTRIDGDFPSAEKFFPEFNEHDYRVIFSEAHDADSRNRYNYRFVVYELKADPMGIS